MKPLKDREEKILQFMASEIKLKGYPPTVREICSALNIKSTSTAHKDVANLEKKGYIEKDPAKPRAVRVILPEEFSEFNDDDLISKAESLREEVVYIPVVGRVAAGEPILAEENIEVVFPVPAGYVRGENFMLKVRGDSMIEAGIFDGDYILIRKQETANNGDMVVALVDGFETEATVKTFYREDGHIRLQPENSSMSAIILEDVRIAGIVKGVFRYF